MCADVLLLEQMPEGLGQQVALFASASAVVGLDGAWQNNILFMRPGARMVSLQPGDLTQLTGGIAENQSSRSTP